MGFDLNSFANIISKPLVGVQDFLRNAWNDYTGVTASEMSAKAAKENTEKQLAWERERATSAHQWEVEDLKKAGLNPVLSAGGSGAVTGGISPQMPDYSQYKGWGALIPLISNYYENMTKNSATAKNNAETELANTRAFTESTQQLLNLYQAGLIDQQTASEAIRTEMLKTDKKWQPYEKGVKLATDVVSSVTPFAMFGGAKKLLSTTAMQTTNKLNKIEKSINKMGNSWKDIGDGKRINIYTGEIKNTGKTIYFNKDNINRSLNNKIEPKPKNYKKKYL